MKTVVLSIDFINDICHPDGKIASMATALRDRPVIARANQVLAWARRRGHQVAHVKVGFDSAYAHCPDTSPLFGAAKAAGALRLGSWGTAFCDDLEVAEDEPVIVKHRVSAFYGTDLETLLRARGATRLILTGVSTELAIQSTAREGHDRDYAVIVVSDACASAEPALHDASLTTLARIAQLRSAAEVTAEETP